MTLKEYLRLLPLLATGIAIGALPNAGLLLASCPCQQGCVKTACWRNSDVCYTAKDPTTGTPVATAWLDTYAGTVNPQPLYVLRGSGWIIDLYNGGSCFGVCTAQGCNVGDSTEDGSSSCEGDFELVYSGYEQKDCVPEGDAS